MLLMERNQNLIRRFWLLNRVIGIGGSLRAAPLPHRPACGSAPGGSKS